jgi:hypothetical protein
MIPVAIAGILRVSDRNNYLQLFFCTTQRKALHMRKISVIALCAAVMLAAGLTTGCVSQKASMARLEFAIESEIRNRDNADAQRRLFLEQLEANIKNEVDRIQATLVSQNVKARGNPARIAQNYIDYYSAMRELEQRIRRVTEVQASLNQEQVTLGRGFRQLSRMADDELRIPTETAYAAIAESLRVVDTLYQENQRSRPVPIPEPTPAPKPEPEIIFEENPPATPVAPAPVAPAASTAVR